MNAVTDKPFTLLALSGRDAARETLGSFAEGGRILEFTLPYAPPYEDFGGIRELQLAVRRMGTFPPDTLVIDLSEWIGHEEEEFFEVTAMFLHDHRDLWNFLFLVRERDAEDCAAMFFTLRAFLVGELREDRTFADRESLVEYLTAQQQIEPEAADRLAGILLKPGAQMLRSYPRVNALLDELARGGKITEARLSETVNDPTSVLHLVAGREIRLQRPERSLYGKEAI